MVRGGLGRGNAVIDLPSIRARRSGEEGELFSVGHVVNWAWPAEWLNDARSLEIYFL